MARKIPDYGKENQCTVYVSAQTKTAVQIGEVLGLKCTVLNWEGKKEGQMTEATKLALKRASLTIDAYGVETELSALPTDNATLKSLKEVGTLLCLWIKALDHDLTPPEVITPATDLACIERVVELATWSDGNAWKARDLLTKKLGQKQLTLPYVIQSIKDWIILSRAETPAVPVSKV